MPYGPPPPESRADARALGIPDVARSSTTYRWRFRASRLDLPEPQPELELAARLQGLAARNRTDLASFLGAGVYRHWTPPAVDQLLLRGEWYTAYTPYQPEISQGTLQSIYEYESLIGELMDLDVVSASHYDGAAATGSGSG
jgi:glycine dehydrogenase subunit 1